MDKQTDEDPLTDAEKAAAMEGARWGVREERKLVVAFLREVVVELKRGVPGSWPIVDTLANQIEKGEHCGQD